MTEEKLAREDNIEQVKIDIREAYAEKFAGHEDEDHLLKEVKQITEDLEKDVVRESITIDKIRPDGRKLMKSVHCHQRSAYCHVYMDQVCSHEDKHKLYQLVHSHL